MWFQKLLAGKTATGIAICMSFLRPPDRPSSAPVGSRWRTQRVLPASQLPAFGLRLASPVISSSSFLKRLTGVGLGMSYSFLECPIVLLKDSSSIPSASLPSPGDPSLTPPPHTLQTELGACLSVSQTFPREGAQWLSLCKEMGPAGSRTWPPAL